MAEQRVHEGECVPWTVGRVVRSAVVFVAVVALLVLFMNAAFDALAPVAMPWRPILGACVIGTVTLLGRYVWLGTTNAIEFGLRVWHRRTH
ncbi:MAG: hypothetical protein ACRDGJ_00300 [Candidatus Limnocylindria bacterium]